MTTIWKDLTAPLCIAHTLMYHDAVDGKRFIGSGFSLGNVKRFHAAFLLDCFCSVGRTLQDVVENVAMRTRLSPCARML